MPAVSHRGELGWRQVLCVRERQVAQQPEQVILVVRVVRLGSARMTNEGTRMGTVRRPPRGVPKSEFAAQDWYDVWYPNLAPSAELVVQGRQAKTEGEWRAFAKRYRAEMSTPQNSRTLDVLAVLSQHANFSVGCYREDASRCHRSVLRALLKQGGAKVE
jgi:uncharacterized protein YeaO (DUF488 family)